MNICVEYANPVEKSHSVERSHPIEDANPVENANSVEDSHRVEKSHLFDKAGTDPSSASLQRAGMHHSAIKLNLGLSIIILLAIQVLCPSL